MSDERYWGEIDEKICNETGVDGIFEFCSLSEQSQVKNKDRQSRCKESELLNCVLGETKLV